MDERSHLIQKAKEVSKKLGKRTISKSEFVRETGISQNRIYQNFDGIRELCELAGLEPYLQNVRLSDDQIFSAMRDAFVELGQVVPRHKFDRVFRYSVDVLKKRGWKWDDALIAFRRWCEKNDPSFELLNDLPVEETASHEKSSSSGSNDRPQQATWSSTTGKHLGEFLSFRGLQHAPVNEQGVVLLFGMVAHELGFAVESVQTGYPDCEAKRRIGQARWERVRIEFEYKSRSFRDHGHDPNGCDLVVCWEHNYPDCPIEVVELREAIKSLPS